MDLRACKLDARRSLEAAGYDPKKLALIHGGAALLLSLILTVLSQVLSTGIDSTGGLAGIGTRSALMAGQSFLSLALTVAMPFWDIGFVFAGLKLARGERAEPSCLPEGFRRAGKVLRLLLLQGVIFMGVGIACMYVSSILFALTPFFAPLAELMEPYITSGLAGTMPEISLADSEKIVMAMVPMYVIFVIVFGILAIPLFYKLRMAQWAIMDDAPGAMAALAVSSRMTRGNKLSLFRLDLSFWWFYVAQVLISLLGYGDMILAAVGITLPVDGTVLFFGFYIAYILLQTLLVWQAGSYLQTTYGHCYDRLKNIAPPPVSETRPTPKMPW